MTKSPISKEAEIANTTPSTTPLSNTIKSMDIRTLTHNIRYATTSPFPGEELWPIRCPRLCSELIFNSILPTTFICLQEVLQSQLLDILSSLNSSESDEWSYVGLGRDDGKEAGEYSPIFYRPKIWSLITAETLWLSPTPEVPSKGWDAACIRIVTIAIFVDCKTGKKVLVLNTHFDDQGIKSREESAKMILGHIRTWGKLDTPDVVLLAGDFNSNVEDKAYIIMTGAESGMEDIGVKVDKGKRYGNEMTFTSFGSVDNTPSRIDFIFGRKGDKVRYQAFGVLANRFDDGVYLSDHRACVADVILEW